MSATVIKDTLQNVAVPEILKILVYSNASSREAADNFHLQKTTTEIRQNDELST